MYLIDEIVDDVVDGKWKTPTHRKAAIAICIGNPLCKTMDSLKRNIGIIQGLSEAELQSATLDSMRSKGCDI
jgi:hypothetical protein